MRRKPYEVPFQLPRSAVLPRGSFNVVFGAYGGLAEPYHRIPADLPIATGHVDVKRWGSRLLSCYERCGLRHPSILCTATGRLRRRLRSDRSVRAKSRNRREIALSVFEREEGQG